MVFKQNSRSSNLCDVDPGTEKSGCHLSLKLFDPSERANLRAVQPLGPIKAYSPELMVSEASGDRKSVWLFILPGFALTVFLNKILGLTILGFWGFIFSWLLEGKFKLVLFWVPLLFLNLLL